MARRRHTSGSTIVNLKPNPSRCSAKKAQRFAPENLNPQSARTITNGFSSSCPNSGPAQVYNYSRIGAVKYAFLMSTHLMSNSLIAAMRRHIRTDSRDTTELYVTDDGVSVCDRP